MKRNACALAALCLLLGCLLTGCGSGGKAEPSGTWQENYDLGVRYLSEGNYKEAVLAFQAAVRIDPKRVETYVALAEAQIASGEQEAAVKTLREGIDATGDATLEDYLLWAETSQDTSVDVTEIKKALTPLEGGNLSVEILGSRTMRITVRDEQMLPVYTVKKKDADDTGWDFSWRVDFSNGTDAGIWQLGTFAYKNDLPDGEYTVAQMIPNASVYDWYEYREGRTWSWSAGGIDGAEIRTSVWSNGITWLVTFPDNEDTAGMDLLNTEFFVLEIEDGLRDYRLTENYTVENGKLSRVGSLPDMTYGERPDWAV